MGVSTQYINAPKPGQADYYGADLAVGFSALSSRHAAATAASATQLMNVGYFMAPKSYTATQVKFASGSGTVSSGLTLARVGIYSVTPSTGALTALLASTTSDTTFGNVNNTVFTKALSASVPFVQGTWYAVAILQVGSVTAQVISSSAGGNVLLLNATTPRLAANVAGQTDLPASVASGSLGTSNVGPWVDFI